MKWKSEQLKILALALALVLLAPAPRARADETTVIEVFKLAAGPSPAETAVPAEDPSAISMAIEVQPQIHVLIPDDGGNEAELAAPVVTLNEVVAAAISHSPGLAAMQWQALSAYAQSEAVSGYGGLKSELSILGLHTNSPLGVFAGRLSQGRVTQMDFDPAALNDPEFFGNVEYKLMLMYPLFDSGRVQLLADAVALNSNAIDLDALGREHELTAKVIEAYFNHALLTDQLVVIGDAQLTVEELQRMIQQLYDEGLVIGSDLAAADVQLANIEDELNRAESYRGLVEDTLSILTGGATGGAFSSSVPLELSEAAVPELDELTALALEHRPELAAMRLRVCAATNMLDEAIKRRNPTVGVFAEGKHSTPAGFDNGHSEATFGAQLTLDLDTGDVIRNQIEQRRADLQAANLGLQQLEELAEIDVIKAHTDLVIARQSIETFTAQAERAGENLRVVRNRYKEGLTNYLDLRMAISEHKESRLRQVKARHDYLLAYMQLLVAAGLTGTEFDPFLGAAGSLSPEQGLSEGGCDV